MKVTRVFVLSALALLATPLMGQPTQGVAPKFAGMSVQGSTVSLDVLKSKKTVLLLFYRTHA